VKVLVTGADGYVGAVLGPALLERGHDVTGLDSGYYRAGWLFEDGRKRPRVMTRDIRDITQQDLEGYEAIIHLGELSNDPLGEHDPGVTFEINHRGSVALARLAKAAGVRRFVYSSSCSIYGVSHDAAPRREDSPADPQTAYAACKVLVERDVAQLADPSFTPVFLRNATAFGPSPRMRFDIVLNNLAGLAWTARKIAMTSDGSPWRPLIHVEDICQAMALALEAQKEAVHCEIINVGSDEQNYQIRQIADVVANAFSDCKVSYGPPAADNRSYRVSFTKIRQHLPGFRCRWSAADGAHQLRALFEQIQMSSEVFSAPSFTRLLQLQHLRKTGQIDDRFRWTRAA
jgi:nucleoside-diphosphate-sugar epimerase